MAKGGATELMIEWAAAGNDIPPDDRVDLTLYDDRTPDAACPFICVSLKELHAAVVAMWEERKAEKNGL